MKAIDLYSGIGGWALGLKVAGIEVVRSYEWWEPAANTEEKNLGVEVVRGDIRQLDLATLPDDIDIVVGSPPCTQFSYANRGGSGDIADGLKDIAKFLSVVNHLKPKFWAMENVPRVAKILEEELVNGRELEKFAHLRPETKIHVFDLSEFGAPQRRKRCIAGNYPLQLLKAYAERCPTVTLGETVSGFESSEIKDVNYNFKINKSDLTDNIKEQFFDFEEARINKEAKSYHPVYNDMAFPDLWDRPVRTVTATCTRVSRESIVVEDVGNPGSFRRLTVRERGALQGFPITYQFYGKSYSEKLKMIGNAIPPVFTYYLANAIKGVSANNLILLADAGYFHKAPADEVKDTPPDQIGRTYPKTRRFWFAVPNLRFKSGTRFDLVNRNHDDRTDWFVEFYFGSSTDIRSVELSQETLNRIYRLNWFGEIRDKQTKELEIAQATLDAIKFEELQDTWTTKSMGAHPFKVLDVLGDTAKKLIDNFPEDRSETASDFVKAIARQGCDGSEPIGEKKLEKYASEIFCGLLLGSWFNAQFSRGYAS